MGCYEVEPVQEVCACFLLCLYFCLFFFFFLETCVILAVCFGLLPGRNIPPLRGFWSHPVSLCFCIFTGISGAIYKCHIIHHTHSSELHCEENAFTTAVLARSPLQLGHATY